MSTQIGVPVSHPVPRSSSRCAEVRSQRPSRPSHPSVVTAVFGAGRGAAGPGRAGGVRDRSAPPGAAAAHLGILKGCGFFFTFPQCHDFRFPPSKKKKKAAQSRAPRSPRPQPWRSRRPTRSLRRPGCARCCRRGNSCAPVRGSCCSPSR